NQVSCLIALIALATFIFVPSVWAQAKLVVAIQPTVARGEILAKPKPRHALLEKNISPRPKVEIYAPSSYAAVVESLRFGHAHVALMSAWPAQLAVRLGGAQVAL